MENASNLTAWTMLANNLVATNTILTYSTNLPDTRSYFRVYRMP